MRIIIYLFLFLPAAVCAQSGVITSYNLSGNLEYELSYVNDALDGTSYWYYDNGNLKAEKTYSLGRLNGVVKLYHPNGLLKEEYSVKMGVLDGEYKVYYENGALGKVLSYNMGQLIDEVVVDYDANYVASVDEYVGAKRQYEINKTKQGILCDADVCPTPVGGFDSLYDNVKYPEHAELYGLEGTVTLLVNISSLGDVEDVKVIKELGLGCDEAAIEAVKQTRFLPGQTNGEAVSSQITINIDFKLDDDEDKQEEKVSKADANKLLSEKNLSTADDRNAPVNLQSEERPKYRNMDCNVQVCPHPVGGYQAIVDNFVVPKSVSIRDLKGDVIVKTFVDKYGNVRRTEVLEDVGYGSGVAAEVAIIEADFEAGKNNGEPVDSEIIIVLPIK